ncbi:MAG: ADP-ribosylglycohydrolase family protein [Acidimicrobiales bacterium]
MKLTPAQLDRAAGALVGLAAGDALGAGYEFQASPPGDPAMIGGGPFGWEPGEWTDDTQMALCIAEVAATGDLDPGAVGGRFVDWFASDPADVGSQTRAVLTRAAGPEDLAEAAARHFAAHPTSSAGNGSLMRTAPVALAHLGNDDAIRRSALSVSALTHGDPLAGEACVLWCVAIDRAVRQGRLDGVRDGLALLEGRSRQRWSEWLDRAEDKPYRSFTANGFVVTALQAAHAAITQTPVPEDRPCAHLRAALGAAVSIGHDTDTVAAIAGAVLGARWGASALPMAWRCQLHGWPGYRVVDLIRLAVLAARDGRCDDQAWPSAQHLVGYYDTHHRCAPIALGLPDDPGIILGNVAGLAELPEPVDVVVSLCRLGSEDVPARTEHHEMFLIDSPDPADNPNLDFVLADLADMIGVWRNQGRTVLIHCVRAESRTPTVAAAYLAQRFALSARQALERVETVLPDARPNPGFAGALDRLWPPR